MTLFGLEQLFGGAAHREVHREVAWLVAAEHERADREAEPSIMDFLPIAIEIQATCAKARMSPPTLRFSDADGLKIETLAVAGTLAFALHPAKSSDGTRYFTLSGVRFEWNDRPAQIAKFRADMHAAMTEFATPSIHPHPEE